MGEEEGDISLLLVSFGPKTYCLLYPICFKSVYQVRRCDWVRRGVQLLLLLLLLLQSLLLLLAAAAGELEPVLHEVPGAAGRRSRRRRRRR